MSLLNKEGTVFRANVIGSGPDYGCMDAVSWSEPSDLASDTITHLVVSCPSLHYLVLTPPVSEARNVSCLIPTAVSPHLNAQGHPPEQRPLKKLA